MNLVPITREAFTGCGWMPHSRFHFARSRGVLELGAAELPLAACSMPIGLLQHTDGTWLPAALLGVHPEHNLFVAADGGWLAGYVPLVLRTAPFCLANSEQGDRVICLDESFVPAEAGEGVPFFNSDGEPSEALARARDDLAKIDANRHATVRACDALYTAGLLRPWSIVVQTQAGGRQVQGLSCIDEDALNAVNAPVLQMLRDTGALAVAYCLLISMQHLGTLGKLADAHAALAATGPTATKNGELNLEFLNRSETVRFDH